MTQGELLSLLRDCLALWGLQARLVAEDDGIVLIMDGAHYQVGAVDISLRPARWRLQTPAREVTGRPARMHPSIGALLSSLRNELGANTGNRLRVGRA